MNTDNTDRKKTGVEGCEYESGETEDREGKEEFTAEDAEGAKVRNLVNA